MNTLTVIIPALNEEDYLDACLASVHPLGADIIVADGGSTDATPYIAERHGARIVTAPRGRGTQLRAGATAASGETLLFLHADSVLSEQAASAIATALADPAFLIGTFRLRLDSPHPLYRFYSWCTRFDSLWTSFGDQGIIIRRSFYDHLGGFPDWPLLEDVALLQRARRLTSIRSLPAEVLTSARRFESNGIVRQQIRNARILLRYLRGAEPEELARVYCGA